VDLDRLEQAATYAAEASFCGLGQAAPVPIITGLRYFREEFEAHTQGKCPTGVCPMDRKQ
jgi:NADH-quinone oxidoreductase subunit F